MTKLFFAIGIVISLCAVNQVDALRCWRCSSDISNGDFCKDPFNPSLMSEYQRKWSYVDCVLPVSQLNPLILNKARPVCKKIIQQVREKLVFARACSWEIEGDAPDTCKYAATPPDVKTISCETCKSDGCNGDQTRTTSIYDPYGTTAAPDSGSISNLGVNRFSWILVAFAALLYRLC